MGRKRKTESERKTERFGQLYRTSKARDRVTDEQIAAMLGVSRSTLYSRLNLFDEGRGMRVADMCVLKNLFRWDDSEISFLWE